MSPRSTRACDLEVAVPTAYVAMLDREPARQHGQLERWAARVHIVAAQELDAHYPVRWPARVTAWARGKRHEVLVLDSPGDPALLFSQRDIEDKARRVLGPAGVRR